MASPICDRRRIMRGIILPLFGVLACLNSVAGSEETTWWHGFYGPLESAGVVCSIIYEGNLVVGGSFTDLGGLPYPYLAMWDGLQWQALGEELNGFVYGLCIHEGALVATGLFTHAGDTAVNGIAAYRDGSWQPLGEGLNDFGAVVASYGGWLYVGGAFTTAGGQPANHIAAWDGSSWQEVGTGFDGWVWSLEVWDGCLFAGGDFVDAGPEGADYIAVLEGGDWGDVGGGVNGLVYVLSVYEGNLIAGGNFSEAGGQEALGVATWNGSEWGDVGGGVTRASENGEVLDLTIWNGDLVLVGNFWGAGELEVGNIAQWDGQAWESFDGGSGSSMRTVVVYADEVIVGGLLGQIYDAYARGLARWTGEQWVTFGAGLNGSISEMAVHEDLLVMVGELDQGGLTTSNRVIAWDGDEWVDMHGDPNHSPCLLAVASFGDEFVVGGAFANGWGNPDNLCVAAWNGVTWHPLDRGLNGSGVLALLARNDLLYAGGYLTQTGSGVELHNVAVWNGTYWQDVGGGVNAPATALAYIRAELYVGGEFTQAGGSSIPYLARWTGQEWGPVGGGVNGMVRDMVVYNEELIVAGDFTEAGGMAANHIASWEPHYEDWTPLGEGLEFGPNGHIEDLAVVGQFLVVAGDIGQPTENITYWNGQEWFPIENGPNGKVTAIAAFQDGVYFGGEFTTVGDQQPSRYIARSLDFATSGIPPAGENPVAAGLRLSPSWPNPLQDHTRVRFTLAQPAVVDVNVYDVLGRRVRRLASAPLPAGGHNLSWDGRSDLGQPVESGTYYIRMQTVGNEVTRRVVVVR